MDWENVCSGIKKICNKTKEGALIPKRGFVFKIVGMVEAGQLTSFQADDLWRFANLVRGNEG